MSHTVHEKGISSITTLLRNKDNAQTEVFAGQLVSLMISACESPGFWSAEIIPPSHSRDSSWALVVRFTKLSQAEAWQNSADRIRLLKEIPSEIEREEVVASSATSTSGSSGSVTTAILTDVKRGMEAEYWRWERKIQLAQARFPGYRGAYLQPPAPGREGQWVTLLRFDSPEALESWFASDVRRELLSESDRLVKLTRFKNVTSSFPGWFPGDPDTGAQPAVWKISALVLLGLFPIIILEKIFLSPALLALPAVLTMCINLILSIAFVSYVSNPLFIKTLNWWLLPEKDELVAANLKGAAIALCLLAIEILSAWNLA